MAITYTNEIKTNIVDPLRSLIWTEFKPVDVVLEPGFDGKYMTRGEYIRYWVLDSTEIAKHSDGETREYTIEITFYFDTRKSRVKDAWDDVWTDRAEHLKRLLDNNFSYNDGTYRWHNLVVELEEFDTVESLEDIEGEETIAQRFEITLTRSIFR